MGALKYKSAPEIPRRQGRDGARRVESALLNAGAVIVDAAADCDLVADIDRALAPYFAATPTGEDLFLGRKTKRFSGLFAKTGLAAELAIDPLVLAVAQSMLGCGKNCDRIQLNLTQAISIGPGQGAQVLHRDDTAFPFAHDFELMINAMWPLDAFTMHNGATEFVPFSHAWDRGLRPQPHESIPALADPGAVILWLGSVFHGGGANRSPEPRRGIVFSYSLAWLAQAEKLLLSTPPHVARMLPEQAQRLIGYQVHRPNLGWIEERDPLDWLHGEVGAVAAAQDHFTPELKARLEAALGEA
jgi:hypothetical protein